MNGESLWTIIVAFAIEPDSMYEKHIALQGVPRIGERLYLHDVAGHAAGTSAIFIVDDVAWQVGEPVWLGLTHQPEDCEAHDASVMPLPLDNAAKKLLAAMR